MSSNQNQSNPSPDRGRARVRESDRHLRQLPSNPFPQGAQAAASPSGSAATQSYDNYTAAPVDAKGASPVMPAQPDVSNQIQRLEDILDTVNIGHQRDILNFQDQAETNSQKLSELQTVLHDDFGRVHSLLQGLESGMDEMRAKTTALEAERGQVAAYVKARSLAEAESHELFARRIREHLRGADASFLTQLRARLEGIPGQIIPGQVIPGQVIPDLPEETEGQGSTQSAENPVPVVTEQSEGSEKAGSKEGSDSASKAVAGSDVASDQRTLRNSPAQIACSNEGDGGRQPGTGNDEQTAKTPPTQQTERWLPFAIRHLTPLALPIPPGDLETFTWAELRDQLGGDEYSPGLYFNPYPVPPLPGRCYWVLNEHNEPYAPAKPGHHGAKLTAFFNMEPNNAGKQPASGSGKSDDQNVPVFIALGDQSDSDNPVYTYIGQYSQTRYSDTLSHSEMFDRVPPHVIDHWTARLSSPERPDWVAQRLAEHFWPPPSYAGPLPSDSASTTPETRVSDKRNPMHGVERSVARALHTYSDELGNWKKEVRLKANFCNANVIAGMWDKADWAVEKGLRLCWEYLECVGWDGEFYDKLCEAKEEEEELSSDESSGEEADDEDDEDEGTGKQTHQADPTKLRSNKPQGKIPMRKFDVETDTNRQDTIEKYDLRETLASDAVRTAAKEPVIKRSKRPSAIRVVYPANDENLKDIKVTHSKNPLKYIPGSGGHGSSSGSKADSVVKHESSIGGIKAGAETHDKTNIEGKQIPTPSAIVQVPKSEFSGGWGFKQPVWGSGGTWGDQGSWD